MTTKLPRLNSSWQNQPGLLERNWDTAMNAIEKAGPGNTTIYIYHRAPAAPTPPLPTTTATYTFSTGAIIGLNNGWVGTIPAATGDPLWVSTVVILSGTDTVNIDPSLWAPAQILAENGATGPMGPAGTPGLDGAPGAPGHDGVTYYTWIAYADSSDGSVNFSNGSPGDRHYIGIASNKTTPTESTNPSDYTWSAYAGPPNFGLVNGANVNIAGEKITKISGTNGNWDASGYSSEAWIGGCTVSVKAGDLTGGYVVGLNTDPTTDSDYASIDYSFYFNGVDNRIDIDESGVLVLAGTTGSGWLLTDVFSISYDGKNVAYFKNGTVFYSHTAPAGLRLYVDTSFKTMGSSAIIAGFSAAGAAGISSFTLVNGANMSISGSSATKTGGTGGSWDSYVYSAEGYAGAATMSFQPAISGKEFLMGLSVNPTSSASYDVDYCIVIRSAGSVEVFEFGVGQGTFGTWSVGDTFQVTYTGAKVVYIKNGSTIKTTTGVTTGQVMHLDSSFSSVDAQANNITFARAGADGTDGVNGSLIAVPAVNGSFTAAAGGAGTTLAGTASAGTSKVNSGATVSFTGGSFVNSGTGTINLTYYLEWSNAGANSWNIIGSNVTTLSSVSGESPIADFSATFTPSGGTGFYDFRWRLTRSGGAGVNFNSKGSVSVG